MAAIMRRRAHQLGRHRTVIDGKRQRHAAAEEEADKRKRQQQDAEA